MPLSYIKYKIKYTESFLYKNLRYQVSSQSDFRMTQFACLNTSFRHLRGLSLTSNFDTKIGNFQFQPSVHAYRHHELFRHLVVRGHLRSIGVTRGPLGVKKPHNDS